jgi:hypothetical protein
MLRRCCLLAAAVLLLGVMAQAQTTPALQTAHGRVEKVGMGTLTILPRGEGGRFEKSVVFRKTGTTDVSVVGTRAGGRGKKPVLFQRKIELGDLKAGQTVAVIYARTGEGNTLLAVVAQPGGGK